MNLSRTATAASPRAAAPAFPRTKWTGSPAAWVSGYGQRGAEGGTGRHGRDGASLAPGGGAGDRGRAPAAGPGAVDGSAGLRAAPARAGAGAGGDAELSAQRHPLCGGRGGKLGGREREREKEGGRGCQREIWSASNHLLRELRLHLPPLFFPRRGLALSRSYLLGLGWLVLFNAIFCSGCRGPMPAGRSPARRLRSRGARCPQPGPGAPLCSERGAGGAAPARSSACCAAPKPETSIVNPPERTRGADSLCSFQFR